MNFSECFSLNIAPENVQLFETGYGDEKYYYDDAGFIFHVPMRTKYSHPYSYDPITLIDNCETPVESVYSDRLISWHKEKFDIYMQKFNNGAGELNFNWHDSKEVTNLCKFCFERELRVCKVVEICNISNGYPIWIIYFSEFEQK